MAIARRADRIHLSFSDPVFLRESGTWAKSPADLGSSDAENPGAAPEGVRGHVDESRVALRRLLSAQGMDRERRLRNDPTWRLLPVVPTPLRDGEIDEASIGTLVAGLAPYVDGLTVLGSSGESAYFSTSERLRALGAFGAAAEQHGLPIVAGITDPSVAEARAFLCSSEAGSVAAFLVLPPTYYPATLAATKRQLAAIAAATERPIVFYDIPRSRDSPRPRARSSTSRRRSRRLGTSRWRAWTSTGFANSPLAASWASSPVPTTSFMSKWPKAAPAPWFPWSLSRRQPAERGSMH